MHALRHARKNLDTMTYEELLIYAKGRRAAADTAIANGEHGRALGYIDAAKKAERKARTMRD